MPSLVEMLGETLITADGSRVDTVSLASESHTVGLYFSASWCPPCQGFTAKLAEFYAKFKEAQHNTKLEIVLISSDRDETTFQEYFQQMQWLALPFVERDRKVSAQQCL